MSFTKNLNKLLLVGAVLVGNSMNGNCIESENPLLNPESAIQLGKKFTSGAVEDTSIISNAVDKIIKKNNLPFSELMRNLDLLYYYSPQNPEIEAACNLAMIKVANKVPMDGKVSYKIIALLFESQINAETSTLNENAKQEVIEDMIGRFNALVNGDKNLAQPLREKFSQALSKDKVYSLYSFK